MNMIHLKYVSEVAKTGSINKAAENLYMGQPNLSRAIRELEATLGIVLFERSSKGMELTPEGEEFLGYANRILAELGEIEALYRSGETRHQRFSIAAPRASYIAEAFTRFSAGLAAHLPMELYYQETNGLRAINSILESGYRLGIIRYAAEHASYFEDMLQEKGLDSAPIAEFSYRLLFSERHPLACRDVARLSELAPHIELAYADPFTPSLPGASARLEEGGEESERRIFVFERASQLMLLSENHGAYMWTSPTPKPILRRYGLTERTCRERERRYRDVLIHRKGYRLSTLDRAFLAELRKICEECMDAPGRKGEK